MMSKPKLVVVGNGMAGVRCVEEILQLAPDRYDITIIGSEPRPNYNRILLSKVLQGDASLRDIVTHDWPWYAERGIRLLAGSPVVRVDPAVRAVETASGLVVSYDKLLLATGSSAFMPPLPGVGKPGVIGFRSVDDCERMMELAASYRKAAVVGGGLLGLEAARGLLNLGMEVTVVHNATYLMNRQLDRMSADMLRAELERQGMRFLMGKRTERIFGRRRAEGLTFDDGAKLQADLIVMAVGVRPNLELAKSSGAAANRAFVVNDYMETSVPGIYAVGECAEHDGTVYGLVAPLFEQAKVLARVLCGAETPPYRGSVPHAKLKIAGIDVFSAGDVNDPEAETVVQQYDGIRKTYKKVLAKRGKLAGAMLFGDVGESNALLGLLRSGADAAVLGRMPAGNGGGGEDAGAAAMPDAETVCQCNGVTKGTIVQAVCEGGLNTVEQVRERTKASGSCGGCKPLVAAIVKLALAGGETKEEEPAVCGCTELGHAALKAALAAGGFAGADEAMRALGWRRPGGCVMCRGAIRYYLGAAREAERAAAKSAEAVAMTGENAMEEPTAVNLIRVERLRRVADALERRDLPYVRVTGEGEFALPAGDLAEPFAAEPAGDAAPLPAFMATERNRASSAVRADSEEPAFARVLVGSDGEAAVRVGARLAKQSARLRLPASTAIAVVSVREEREGWLVRDFALAESPAGWELHAGGHAARPVRQSQLLAIAATEAEAAEMAVACLAWYGESAYYGESAWRWLERVGLVALRERLLDPDWREELLGYGADRMAQPVAAAFGS